jgi:integrase
MPRPKTLNPKYRHHKATGRAYVVVDGKSVYLGDHGTAASWKRYHAVLAEWAARGHQGPPAPEPDAAGPTVSTILANFWRHATGYYRVAEGERAGEADNYRQVVRVLRHLYGGTPAAEFGPLRLKAVREYVLKPYQLKKPSGETVTRPAWSRTYANRQVGRIKAIFKWAAENELVPSSVHHGLLAVAGLRKGRSDARETDPVTPAPEHLIGPVRGLVSSQIRAMIDLQLLTGARPGELCTMRTCDVDTSGKVWVYRPESHKTAHHGHRREIFIGPKARDVLAPLLKPDVQAYVFSPSDAERARAERLRLARKTPVQPSQVKRAEKAKRRRRKRAPSDRYDVASYRRAIARACAKAFPPPDGLEGERLKAWVAEHRWHPHQLRHNAATRLRREYGLEAAQVILGHKTLAVTEIYAERNVAAARKIMGEVG